MKHRNTTGVTCIMYRYVIYYCNVLIYYVNAVMQLYRFEIIGSFQASLSHATSCCSMLSTEYQRGGGR